MISLAKTIFAFSVLFSPFLFAFYGCVKTPDELTAWERAQLQQFDNCMHETAGDTDACAAH